MSGKWSNHLHFVQTIHLGMRKQTDAFICKCQVRMKESLSVDPSTFNQQGYF